TRFPCEQLAEIAEAAVHRVAAQADDPGLRQRAGDESRVEEIVWKLVDEARLGAGRRAGTGNVGLAQSMPVDPAGPVDRPGIKHPAVTLAGCVLERHREALQLTGRIHLRMTGDDPVDQGGSRA